MSRALAQQVGHGADVVLVAVGQHQRVDVVEAVPDRVEVGQDQVDARVVLLGEEHPAVDDQQASVVLEDGHVAADLAEAAERDHPQAALGQGGGRGQLGVGMAQRRRPASVRAARTASDHGRRRASTSGSRTVRLSCTPSSSIAALAVITPGLVTHDRVDHRHQLAVDLQGAVEVAGVDPGDHVGVLLARRRGRPPRPRRRRRGSASRG